MSTFSIAGRRIGPDDPVYVIAELSANHHQSYEEAENLVRAAKEAGADAVKLQTYTADTMTIPCSDGPFRVRGTIWEGKNLHDLYQEAQTPWEWHEGLFALARELGMHAFSTPFDATAVGFLDQLKVPAWKIASFELVDLPLIRLVAATGGPVILSTGMATLDEIGEAVATARGAGAKEIALLKCTSGYPAVPEEMHLHTIPHLAETFGVVVGLSDHTLGSAIPVAAVALGARIIEKHLTMSRAEPGPDSAFSLEPAEFNRMVEDIRVAECALGTVYYGVSAQEAASRAFRRSLFIVDDVRAGEMFTSTNIRSIRPGDGLPPRHLVEVLGSRAACDLARGTPLKREHLA